jgi:hypothetical protein
MVMEGFDAYLPPPRLLPLPLPLLPLPEPLDLLPPPDFEDSLAVEESFLLRPDPESLVLSDESSA